MALYNLPPGMGFGNFSGGASDPTQPQSEASDPISQFLQRLQGLFEEDEADEAPPLPQMPSPSLGQAIGAAYSRTPGAYPTLEQLGQQRMAAEQYNAQLPYKQYEARQAQRGNQIDRMSKMVNLASLMENRNAQIDLAKARTQKALAPGTDDKVWLKIKRVDPATGRVYTRDMPRSEARKLYDAGLPIDVIGEEGNLSGLPVNRFLATTQGWQEVSPLGAPGSTGFYPPAPQGVITSLQQQMGLVQQLREGMRAFNSLAKSMSVTGRLALDFSRTLPGGRVIAGWVTPKGELTAKALDIAGDTVLRIASGAQISEPEAARIRAFLPRVGDSPQAAAGAFAQTWDRLAVALETQMAVRPDLVPPSLVFEIRQLADESRAASGANSPQTLDDILEP